MSMELYSVYRVSNGAFTGQQIGLPAVATDDQKRHTLLCVPAGCAAILGRFDHLSQRVDLATGTAVDYQPPQPSPDHEWDDKTKRWQLNANALKRQRVIAEITALEEKQTSRMIREVTLGRVDAVKQLQALDAKIAALRTQLT